MLGLIRRVSNPGDGKLIFDRAARRGGLGVSMWAIRTVDNSQHHVHASCIYFIGQICAVQACFIGRIGCGKGKIVAMVLRGSAN